jgi:N-acyl homoserine lactone hydrolase
MALDHSIWTFCYARGRLPADFMGGVLVRSNQGLVDIPMLYSLIESGPRMTPRRLTLVDVGFATGVSMSGRKFDDFEQPEAILGKVGVRPDQIDSVILTHLHFDHAGNFDAFPNARIFVQRREYEKWQEVIAAIPDLSVGKQSWMLSSLDVEVLRRFEAAVRDGRVTLLEGDREVSPGIWCRLAEDTHTFGSQWVEVATADGPFVLAGDCVYWYANLERMWPPGYLQGNAWNLMHTFERLRRVVDDRLERIIPGHDMDVFSRHKSWVAGLNPVAEIHRAAP